MRSWRLTTAMLMMCPALSSWIIPEATALLVRKTDFRFVFITASQVLSSASWVGPKYPMPALLTRISIGPSACSVFLNERVDLSGAREHPLTNVANTVYPPDRKLLRQHSRFALCRVSKFQFLLPFAPDDERRRAQCHGWLP